MPDLTAGRRPTDKPYRGAAKAACGRNKSDPRAALSPHRRPSVNVFLILAMGAAVGFVSGMFGIGGGF